MPTQVLPKVSSSSGSLRERLFGMFQANAPENAPAAPPRPPSEAEKLAALLARAQEGDQQPGAGELSDAGYVIGLDGSR